MEFPLDWWIRFWSWMPGDNGIRATVILVFITAWYAYLTLRMANAIARQTRALIQPIVVMSFNFGQENLYPAGSIEIKNIGTQPLLILDLKLMCIASFNRTAGGPPFDTFKLEALDFSGGPSFPILPFGKGGSL
jgi:hypothetical protein